MGSCATTERTLDFIFVNVDRVTKVPFGHSELLTTESAIKELSLDISFNAVHNAKVKLWPLEVRSVVAGWTFREHGAERIDTAIVKVGFRHLKRVLQAVIGRNEL